MRSKENAVKNRINAMARVLLCLFLVLSAAGCAKIADGSAEQLQPGSGQIDEGSAGQLQPGSGQIDEGSAGQPSAGNGQTGEGSAGQQQAGNGQTDEGSAERLPDESGGRVQEGGSVQPEPVADRAENAEDVMEQGLHIENPRVNFMESPQGIDSLPVWFSWEPPFLQESYEIVIERNGSPVWKSGKVQSDQAVNVSCDGRALESHCTYQYSITAYDAQGNEACSEKASFSTAYLDGGVFEESKFICLPDGMESNKEGQGVYGKAFAIPAGKIEKVWFYGSALGIYEAWINGVPVGDDLWMPGWTDYRKTLLYNVFDITDAVKQGENNSLTAMVNDGWWNGDNAFGTYGTHKPAFICEILVCYADGSKYRIGTDESWNCSTDTDIQYADFFQGETCDLRLPSAAETAPGELKVPVGISTIFKGKFQSAWMYGVKPHADRTFAPADGYIYEGTVSDGTTYGAVSRVAEQITFPLTLEAGQTLLVDLGQNIAGVPEIVFSAKEGTRIDLQFAEMLNDRGERTAGNDGPAGSLYRENYRAARTEVKVTASGEGEQETYRSVFFFTGFRYMTVEASEETVIKDLKGIGTGNASPETGTLVTDNEKLNRLFENAAWSQRNNFTLIATDCPQRDERLGWMGDLQSFCKTSLYNQDLYSFYRKWEQDLVDAQRGSGAYTDTAPSTANTGAGNAGWAEAGILVPWNVYCMYGNTGQLEKLFDSMTRYMDYLESKSDFTNGPIGGGTAYGDWLSKEKTDKHFLAALWYGGDALVMQKIAGVLGKEAEKKRYEALHSKIAAFVKAHYLEHPENLSQTEMCFLLQYGFLEEQEQQAGGSVDGLEGQEQQAGGSADGLEGQEQQAGGSADGSEEQEPSLQNLKERVAQILQDSVEAHDHLLMTGFAGTPILLQTLTDMGRSDLAYRVLTAEGNPSWLYSVNQGATTIWERYDSYTLEKGFASAAMNSFDHFNEGSVAQWMYESMAGISMDMAREIPLMIKPVLPPEDVDLHEVKADFHSVYGEVSAAWKTAGENVQIDIVVPAGAKAAAVLPIEGQDEQVLLGGTYHFEGKRK